MFVLCGLKIFNPKSFRIVINSIYNSDDYFFVFIILIIAFLSLVAITIVTLSVRSVVNIVWQMAFINIKLGINNWCWLMTSIERRRVQRQATLKKCKFNRKIFIVFLNYRSLHSKFEIWGVPCSLVKSSKIDGIIEHGTLRSHSNVTHKKMFEGTKILN